MILKIMKRIFQKLTYINERNWNFYLKFYPLLEKGAGIFSVPVLGKLARKAAMLDSEKRHFSQGHIIPLNRDINFREKYDNVVTPFTLLKNIINEAGYIAIMNKCYCRDSLKCKKYNPDFGCIMIGEGARTMEKNGIAYHVTNEQALGHLEKAADMGLIAMALWIELEAFGMGLTEDEHYRLLEICLCCPCCCIGLRNFSKWGPAIMKRFNSIGWAASTKDGCTSCGKCAKVCPMNAITVNENSITVSDECIGCGICASKCPSGAIEMVQIRPFKEKMQDYFWGFHPEV